MNDGVPRHPEAQTMAAFVDGTLAPGDAATVAAHLRECGDCRIVVAETSRFSDEERRRSPKWWIAAAAILAAIVIAIPVLRPRTPMEQLIKAAPREHRVVEARLSGFAWARLQPPSRGVAAPDPADLKLAGAAGEVLDSQDAHANGVAYLLIERRAEAVAALARAAQASNDARVWSDLAAARYAIAIRDNRVSELPQALSDVDHALRLDPRSPEALFNRALIIESLGLRDQAHAVWAQYLDVDPSSGWATEAREHLRKLDQHTRRFDRKLLDELPPAQLVSEFPQEARRWGEGVLLAEWAEAPGDAKLAQARAIANALAQFNGEHMLDDAVGAIERGDEKARAAIAEGHRAYKAAGVHFMQRRSADAAIEFRRAIDRFEQGGSPMAQNAAYYAASVDVDQNRLDAAREELRSLLSRVDRTRHRALAASIQWELAVVAITSGDWGNAVRNAEGATSTFTALGEEANTCNVEVIAAQALDLIGDPNLAWQRRVHALATLNGDAQRVRRTAILYGAATVARNLARESAADALLALTVEEARSSVPALASLAHADRARFARADAAAARRELELARAAAMQMPDPMLRKTTLTQIDLATAWAANDNARTIASIADRAVTFFKEQRLGALLPDAYLQRARAQRAAGDDRAAASDYALALAEIDQQTAAMHDADSRASLLDTSAHAVEEAVELHLDRGEISQAFAIADHAKGSPVGTRPTAERGVGIVEYVVLPNAVAAFCLIDNSISAEKIAVDRATLEARVAAFAEKIRRRAAIKEIQLEGAELHRLLIEPLRIHLKGVTEIVLIPDGELSALPFSALYDPQRGGYLVKDFTIRFARNAGDRMTTPTSSLTPALVVADPPAADLPRLREAAEEAQSIAAIYGATLLAGEAATRRRFIAEAERAALIHFSGHADSDAAQSWGSIRLARDGADDGVLGSADIARLSLAKKPLVVLAACGTFRGDAIHVAGMSSIARAFLTAGASAVAGTLWEIDDDVAAAFFRQFHQLLRAGAPPARALREAQLDMIASSDERLRQPATWAPIELLGHV